MNRTAVIVPVKGADPKSRLSTVLNARERGQLVIAMLEDVLQAIIKARLVQHTYIVSSNEEILGFAERYGAKGIHEQGDRGVNEAVKTAMDATSGYDSWMVIPADVPFIDVSDIRNALTMDRLGASVVISPSEDLGGTNLLLVRRGTSLQLHYDDDSFSKHVKSAFSGMTTVSLYYSQTIAFDIDSPRELYRVLKMGRRCSTTTFLARVMNKRRMIKQLNRRG